MTIGDVNSNKKRVAGLDDAASEITKAQQRARTENNKSGSKATSEQATKSQATDSSVQISALAREINAIDVQELMNRKDDKRITELKAQIEAGTYKISSEDIAAKLLLEIG